MSAKQDHYEDRLNPSAPEFILLLLDELEAQKAELIEAIMNAYQQIEYLDEKFKKTGTSAAVLSKLNALIKKYHEVKKVGSK